MSLSNKPFWVTLIELFNLGVTVELEVAELTRYFNYSLDVPITVKRHFNYNVYVPVSVKRHFVDSLDVAINGKRHFALARILRWMIRRLE